jgi:AAA domain
MYEATHVSKIADHDEVTAKLTEQMTEPRRSSLRVTVTGAAETAGAVAALDSASGGVEEPPLQALPSKNPPLAQQAPGQATPPIPTVLLSEADVQADGDEGVEDEDPLPHRDEWWDPALEEEPPELPLPREIAVPVARRTIPPPVFKGGQLRRVEPPPPAPARPIDPPRLCLQSVEEVLNLQSHMWLLKPLFTRGALVVLYGPPGGGKSFLALDWALSIASGRSWLDYDVLDPGPVVYVVGEGKGGLKKRIRAWLQEHGQVTAPAGFILEPVQLLKEDDIVLLLNRIGPSKPVVVVLDTLATCMDGGDENSSKDMSLAIAAAKRIIRETGATVILVHHTVKRGDDERGHSALRGAAETMMLVQTKKGASGGKLILVSNTKQKDEEQCLPITAELKYVDVGTTDDGEPLTSCVLQSAGATPSSYGELPASMTRTLSVIADRFPDGAASTLWRKALKPSNGRQLATRTYHNHRRALLERGLVEPMPGIADHYIATAEGKALASRARQCADVTTTDSRDASDCCGAEVCRSSASGTDPQDGAARSGSVAHGERGGPTMTARPGREVQ